MEPGKPRPTRATVRTSAPEARRPRLFLLSPANCSGQRAALLTRERAEFALARRIREPGGAPLGEVFSFLSGLYFRGKLTYSLAFHNPPPGQPGALVITAGRGLVDPQTPVQLADIAAFAAVPIDVHEPRYREPLACAAAALAANIGDQTEVVLLGSIATDKYVSILLEAFGERLVFPAEFVGRGDMSRGGLLLRAVDAGEELLYVPVREAVRRGGRPAKLEPRK
jgi:hypothetical protein